MGLFPCDQGGHRYYGPQQTIYPAFIDGNNVYRRKLRLCAEHFQGMLDLLEHRTNEQQDGQLGVVTPICVLCGADAADSHLAFFATVYGKGNERRDFWASCHERCAPAAREDWHLAHEGPQERS